MDFYVGIASYKRPEASRTLDYLDSLGFPKERRILSVQTEEDRDAYTRSGLSERVGTFLYREASTAAGNRNTILLNVPEGTNVVFMDDDIKQVVMEDLGLVPLDTLEKFERMCKLGFATAQKNRTICFGLYPVANSYFIRAAKEAGADSVTTEFFCMESRADDRLKARYAAMSEVLGYDIHQFYMENSKQQGYKRLNRAIKAPIIHRMRELTHSLGMRFHVSDAFCRECNDACNCCGVPPEWGVSQTGNIGNAIIIAREKGFVTFSDVMESINKYFDFPWVGACGYNTGSNKARALLYDTTMAQWLRSNWNDTKKGTSPARAYGGVLVPDGKDENGDVIYRYAIKR